MNPEAGKLNGKLGNMRYRRFGRTELNMPMISSGGMRFQTSWERKDKVNPDSVANLEKIVAHALELGIHHFETAHGYGTSEQELGQVLPHYDRSDLIIQTKVAPKENVSEFLKTLETSMSCLKVDYLDLFAVHGINNLDLLAMSLKENGVIDACLKLKAQGVIRHLGFSSHAHPETIKKTVQTGYFDYVNLWYSYMYQWNWPAIQEAHKQDMGVFIISPNDKGGRLYAPPKKLVQLCAPLTPMTFNDVFILANKEIHTISCGVKDPGDYDEHVNAIHRLETLKTTVDEVKTRLNTELKSVRDANWAENYLQGLPEWHQTPGHINIPGILWLWNLYRAFDLVDYARFRYNLLGNSGHWFPGNSS